MKKLSKVLAALPMAILLFAGCEVGLGSAVDTQPPELKITYPEDGVIIRNSFTMSGTAKDETGINKVEVTFVSTSDSDVKYGPFSADVDTVKKTWSFLANKPEDGAFPIPDGEYTAEVTATDNGTRTTTKSKVYKIDNTAPFVVIKRPGRNDSYGRTIKITGDITDGNSLSALYFSVYKKNGEGNIERVGKVQEFQNISGVGLELVVGKYFESEAGLSEEDKNLKEVYDACYNADGEPTQNTFAIIEVADSAKEYKPEQSDARAPALGAGETSLGNLSTCYYLNKDIYDSIYSTKGFNLTNSQIVSVLNGTYADAEKAKQIQEALSQYAIMTDEALVAENISKFTLNPANYPVFSVDNYSLENGFNEITNGIGSISITVKPGSDKIDVRDETVGVYLQQCDKTGKNDIGEKRYLVLSQNQIDEIEDPVKKENAQSSRDGCVTLLDDGGSVGVRIGTKIGNLDNKKFYKVGVDGIDLEGNYIESDSAKGYGFVVKNTGVAPSLTIDEGTEDLAILNKADFSFKGSIKSLASDNLRVYYELTVKNEKNTKEETKSITNEISFEKDSENEGFFKFDLDIPYADLEKAGLIHDNALYLYSVIFKCDDLDNEDLHAADVTRRIHVDTAKPVVKITSVSPTVEFDADDIAQYVTLKAGVKYVNGTVTVNGTIDDNYTLDNTTYSVYKCDDQGNHKESDLLYTGNAGDSMSFGFKIETTDETTYEDNSYIIIEAVAKDKAGNLSDIVSSQVMICQETDKPVLKLSNADSSVDNAGDVNVDTNLFDQTGNNKILGTITDDDGIKYIKVEYRANGTGSYSELINANGKEQTTYSLSAALKNSSGALPEGIYQLKITVEDINGTPLEKEFYIGIDVGAPKLNLITQSGSLIAAGTAYTVKGKVEDSSGKITLYRYVDKTVKGVKFTAKEIADAREKHETSITKEGKTLYIDGKEASEGEDEIPPAEENKLEFSSILEQSFEDEYSSDDVGFSGRNVYYVAEDLYKQCTIVAFSYGIDAIAPTLFEGWTQTATDQEWTKSTSYAYKLPLSDSWNTTTESPLYSDTSEPLFSGIETAVLVLYKDNNYVATKELIRGSLYGATAGKKENYYRYYSAEVDHSAADLGDGTYTGYVFAKDEAGNCTPGYNFKEFDIETADGSEVPDKDKAKDLALAVITRKIDTKEPSVEYISAKIGDTPVSNIGYNVYSNLDDSAADKMFTIKSVISDANGGVSVSGIGKITITDDYTSSVDNSNTKTVIYDSSKLSNPEVTVSDAAGTYSFAIKKTVFAGKTGTHNLIIAVSDVAGNSATNSVKVSVDLTAPVISLNDPTPYVKTGDAKSYNGKIKFTGRLTDETELGTAMTDLEWKVYSVATGGTALSEKGGYAYKDLDGGKTSDFTFYVDTTAIASGTAGTYYIEVSAQDKVGNKAVTSSRYAIYIDQATDLPIINLSNATKTFKGQASKANGNLFGMGSDVIFGNISDDDGVTSYTYTIDGTSYGPFAVSGTSASFEIDLKNLTKATGDSSKTAITAGDHTLTVTALDSSAVLEDENLKLGAAIGTTAATGVTEMSFAYDDDLPVITVTSVNGSSYTNNMWATTRFDILISVSDASSKDGDTGLTVKNTEFANKESSDTTYTVLSTREPGEAESCTYDSASGAFKHTVVNVSKDYRRIYTVEDKYGRSQTAQVLYKVDATAPFFNTAEMSVEGSIAGTDTTKTMAVASSESTKVWFNNANLKLIGAAGALVESNPATTTVTVGGTTYTVNTGTGNAFSTTITFPEGTSALSFNATDQASNSATEVTVKLNVDTKAPAVGTVATSATSINNNSKSAAFTVSATVSDANDSYAVSGIDTVKLYDTVNGVKTEIEVTPAISGTTYTFTVPDGNKTTGMHVYTIEATDKAGNRMSADSAQVSVDTTVPAVEVTAVSPYVNGTTNTVNGKILVSGTAKDETALGTTDALTWELLSSAGASLAAGDIASRSTSDAKGTSALNGTKNNGSESWSFYLDTTKILKNTATSDAKEYKIKVSVKDAAGNTGDNSASYTTIKIDQTTDIPVAVVTNAKADVTGTTVISTTTNKENLFGIGATTIYASVKDDDGIKSVTYSIDGGTDQALYEWESGASSTSKSFEIKLAEIEGLSEGYHTLQLTVTDMAADLSDTNQRLTSAVTGQLCANSQATIGTASSTAMRFAWDTALPTISITSVNGSENFNAGDFISDAAAIVGAVSDGSSVTSVVVTGTDSIEEKSTLSFTSGSTLFTQTLAGETVPETSGAPRSLTFKAIDMFGRESSPVTVSYQIDKVDPVFHEAKIKVKGAQGTSMNEIAITALSGQWFSNGAITITGAGASSNDDKALVEENPDHVTLSYKKSSASEWTSTDINVGAQNKFSTALDLESGSYAFKLVAYDKANRSTETNGSYNLNIDTTAPAVSASSSTASGKVLTKNDTVVVKVTATDVGSGIKKYLVGTTPNFKESDAIGSLDLTTASPNPGEKEITCALKDGSGNSKRVDGEYTIYVRVIDAAGNSPDNDNSAAGSFIVDNTAPEITVKTPATETTVYKTFTIEGTVKDNNLTADSKPVVYYWNGSAYVTAAAYTKSAARDDNNWSIKFDTNAYAATAVTGSTAELNCIVVITDAAGNTTSIPTSKAGMTYTINQYEDRPVITFNEIGGESGTIRKYTASVTGSVQVHNNAAVSDHSGFTVLKVANENMTEEAWKSYVQPENTLSFVNGNFTYEPPKVDGKLEDGTKALYFFVQDADGCCFYTQVPEGAGTSLTTAQLLKTPYIKCVGNDEKDNSAVIVYDVDSNPPTFDKKYYFAGTSTEVENKTAADVKNDIPSELKIGGIKKPDVKFVIEAADKVGVASLTGTLNDAGKTTITFDSTELDGKKKVQFVGSLATADIADGKYQISLDLTDVSGLKQSSEINLTLDKTGPKVEISSPSSSSLLTGNVTVSGTVIDDHGADIVDVKYLIVDNDKNVLGDEALYNLIKKDQTQNNTATVASMFTFPFDGEADGNPKLPSSLAELASYSSFTDSDAQIYDIPVYIMAEDDLGNYTIYKGLAVHYNPFEDRPSTEIIYPDPSKSNTLSGSIRVSGSAIDNESVSKVFIQVRPATGTYETAHSADLWGAAAKAFAEGLTDYTVETKANYDSADKKNFDADENFWGIPAGGTVSWYKAINSAFELQNDSTVVDAAVAANEKTYKIAVRAVALDNNNTLGNWSKPVVITINPSAPSIGSKDLYLKQYSDAALNTETASQNATGTIYLKGQWYFVASVEHKDNIKALSYTISEKDNTTYKTGTLVSDGNCKDSVHANAKTWGSGDSATKGYIVKIPLGTDSDEGEKTIRIDATSGNDIPTNSTYTFFYDNVKPEIKELKQNSKNFEAGASLTNSNNQLSLGSVVTDSTAGFGKVLFYFYRDSSSGEGKERRLYDPYIGFYKGEIAKDNPARVDVTNDSGVAISGITKEVIDGQPLYGVTKTVSKTDDSTLTFSGDDRHIRVGGIAKINDAYRVIKTKSVSGDTVTITFSPECGTAFTSAFFPYAQVVDNGDESLKKFTATEVTIDHDDGDGMPESLSGLTTSRTWEASIHGDWIPDGPVTFVMFAFDKSENVAALAQSCTMANNRPRITRVNLGTDLSGNGTFEDSEYESYSVLGREGASQSVYDLTTKDFGKMDGDKYVEASRKSFTIKDKFSIIPEFTGGNGGIKLVFNNNDTTVSPDSKGEVVDGKQEGEGAALISQVLRASGAFKDERQYDITAVGDDTAEGAVKAMSFTFWDSTDEAIQGKTSQYAFLRIKDIDVKVDDGTMPKVRVNPFYWNSKTDNSVAKDSSGKFEGHVELEADLPQAIINALGNDPKVSGKIIFTGTAYDDHRLGALKFSFGSLSETEAATYTSASGWTGKSGTGWECKVYDAKPAKTDWNFDTDTAYFNQDGHKVYWTLTLDTAQHTTGVAAEDQSFTMFAYDSTGNKSPDEDSIADNGDSVYNKAVYGVDVVPYITSIKTQLSGSEKIPSALNRSASGYYAVRRGETITLSGFNFNATDSTNITKVQINGTDVTALGSTSDANKIVVPVGAGFTNGNVDVLVKNGANYISSLNNANAVPTFDSSMNCTAYAYNAEPNDRNNNILTDDRKLYIMDVTQLNNPGEVRKVDMAVSGNTLNFSAGFDSAYFAYFNNVTTSLSATKLRSSYTRYFENKMAMNESGTIFTVSSCGDTQQSYSGWNKGPSSFSLTKGDSSNQWEYNACGNNIVNLESNYNGAAYNNLDREWNPDMVVSGTDADTKGYITYYDTTQKLVKFRYFNWTSTGHDLKMYRGGASQTNTTEQAVRQYTTDGKSYNQGYVAIAGSGANSPYSSVAVTSDGTAIVSWFDAQSKTLKMKYNTSPATSFSGYQTFDTLPSAMTYTSDNTNRDFIYDSTQNGFYSTTLKNNSSGGKYILLGDQYYKLVYKTRTGNSNATYKYYYTLENYTVTQNFSSELYTSAVTGYGGTFNISVDGGAPKQVSISCATPSEGDINHEFAYQLGLVLGAGNYGAYCEVDPVTNKVTVRSMQTGTGSSIAITNLSSGSVNAAVAGCGQPWVEKTIDDDEAGKFVSMTVDSNNGIHMAYHATGTSDLKYAYLSSVTADPVVVTVDGYQQVGQYIDIATATKTINGTSCIVPFISYYNLSYADSTSAVKCAYLNKPLIPSSGAATISEDNAQGAVDELFTGNWEVTTIPCATTPVQYRVNIGVKTNGDVILSYLGNTIEYVKVW